LFRPYFEAVLMSPASQWLLKSMEKVDFTALGKAVAGIKTDPLVQDYLVEGDMEDMDSCPSTVTYESSGDFFDPLRSNDVNLTQEAYAKLWNQFVDALWNSTDSLWILPCCSDEKSQPSTTDDVPSGTPATFDRQWLSPVSQDRRKVVADVIDSLLLNRLGNVTLGENRQQADYDQWLLKSEAPPPDEWHHIPATWHHTPGISETTAGDLASMEEWLGWKALLEKVRSMGDECWLYRPPPEAAARASTKPETSTTMEY